MRKVQLNKVRKFVTDNIGAFHAGVLAQIRKKTLNELLGRCNPYLYKAKLREDAHDYVERLLADSLSLSERTQFGRFLERLAIYVGEELYGGGKSTTEGVDLEFARDGEWFIVSIKSGPNWGNSSEQKKQREQFHIAMRVARQNDRQRRVTSVLGCCYGKVDKDKGDYRVMAGQAFWHFLSNDDELYMQIVEPLGHEARRHNDEFKEAYAQLLNRMTQEFTNRFCVDGKIQWEELVRFNSARKPLKPPPVPNLPRKRKQARKKG